MRTGRPKKEVRQERRVTFAVTQEEKALLSVTAKLHGLTVSGYIRSKVWPVAAPLTPKEGA